MAKLDGTSATQISLSFLVMTLELAVLWTFLRIVFLAPREPASYGAGVARRPWRHPTTPTDHWQPRLP